MIQVPLEIKYNNDSAEHMLFASKFIRLNSTLCSLLAVVIAYIFGTNPALKYTYT